MFLSLAYGSMEYSQHPLARTCGVWPYFFLGHVDKIIELFAARGVGTPVKFIASAMPKPAPLPSISRAAKRRIAKQRAALIDLPGRAPYDANAIRDELEKRGIRPITRRSQIA
jgi:hypothetical protein